MFSKFLVPSEKNSYYPYVIRKSALTIYTLALFLFNVFSGSILPSSSNAVYASTINTANIIALANKERENSGLVTLTHDSRLSAAARAKASDMLAKDYWDHFGPNGETPWQFITAAGYGYVYAGENLAKGFSTAEGVHQAWMASPTHRANIMNGNYLNIGIAVVDGVLSGEEVTLVVQMFGATTTEIPKAPTPEAPATVVNAPSSNTPPPLPVEEKGEIKSISIERPVNEEVITDPSIDISGSVGGYVSNIGEYSVLVTREETEISSGNSSSDKWSVDKLSDWEEGEHVLTASVVGYDSITDEIVFTVDSSAPVYVENSLSVILEGNHAEVSLFVDEEDAVVLMTSGSETYAFAHEGDGVFTAYVPQDLVKDLTDSVVLSIADIHGNTREIDISTQLSEMSILGLNQQVVSQEAPLASTLSGLSNLDLRAKINIAFAIVLLSILASQVYLYKRKGMLHDKGGYLMTIGVFTLLILVGAVSEISGSIS